MDRSNSHRLTGENIDAASESIEKFLTDAAVDRKNVLRFRLMFEEILLSFRDRFGDEKEFTLLCAKRFSRPRVVITIAGESFEPFAALESDGDYSSETLHGMLANMGLAPSYRYKNGENIITLTAEKKKRGSSALQLVAAIVLAATAGALCLLLPENVREFMSQKVIEPVSDKFMGFLSAVSGPLIFLSVLWGICGIGDVASFGRIGKRMIARFLLMSVVMLLLAACAIIPFFSLSTGDGGKTDFSELYQMLLDIVPTNLITPFTEGNPLQLLLFQILNLILFAVAAIMSVVNIATKEKVLFWVTAVFAVLCLANLLLSKKGHIAKCFFFVETIALLSFFIVTGFPGGFSILWILIVPAAAMSVFGMRVGSVYSTVLFLDVIFFFWTPLGRNLLMYDYSDAYMLRFPFVYVCMYLVSFYLEWIRQKTMENLIETEKKNRWLSRHDALTWAYNRHAFNEELGKILSDPSNKVIGTIMLDIDNFKRINDTYGHGVGDKVICRLSDLIVKNICEHCLFCRWGGEEFLIAMRCEHDPKAIAEVIRSDVEQNRMTLESGETISFTVSVGVSYCESADRNTFIDRVNDADKALYAAKNAGKNVVVVYDPNSM